MKWLQIKGRKKISTSTQMSEVLYSDSQDLSEVLYSDSQDMSEVLYSDSQDMLVLPITIASHYYICSRDGSTSSENNGYI
jgi:hypothetical protein